MDHIHFVIYVIHELQRYPGVKHVQNEDESVKGFDKIPILRTFGCTLTRKLLLPHSFTGGGLGRVLCPIAAS